MPKITVHGGPTSYFHELLEGPAVSGSTADGVEAAVESVTAAEHTDYAALSFVDLRRLARERGLPSGGTAADLVARLVVADGEGDAP